MARLVIAGVSGTLFGAGLALSGMIDPLRVRGFLDLLGRWDPTLAFVMGGATVVMAVAWQLRPRMPKPWLDTAFSLPDTRRLDGRLAAGAVLFGIGWGISGLCPGPAIADLALAGAPALVFLAAMLVGMGLHRLTTR